MSRKLRKLVCKESKCGEMSEEEKRPSDLLTREVGNPYTCVPGVCEGCGLAVHTTASRSQMQWQEKHRPRPWS